MPDVKRAAKVYLPVYVAFREDGQMLPRAILWEDGRKYAIDRVLQVRPAHAARAGGQGDRYTVLIRGQQRYLFFERSLDGTDPILGRWFVEKEVRDAG